MTKFPFNKIVAVHDASFSSLSYLVPSQQYLLQIYNTILNTTRKKDNWNSVQNINSQNLSPNTSLFLVKCEAYFAVLFKDVVWCLYFGVRRSLGKTYGEISIAHLWFKPKPWHQPPTLSVIRWSLATLSQRIDIRLFRGSFYLFLVRMFLFFA